MRQISRVRLSDSSNLTGLWQGHSQHLLEAYLALVDTRLGHRRSLWQEKVHVDPPGLRLVVASDWRDPLALSVVEHDPAASTVRQRVDAALAELGNIASGKVPAGLRQK